MVFGKMARNEKPALCLYFNIFNGLEPRQSSVNHSLFSRHCFFPASFWNRKILSARGGSAFGGEFYFIVLSIFLFIIPLSLYLYLPIRAAANPEFYFKVLNAGSSGRGRRKR